MKTTTTVVLLAMLAGSAGAWDNKQNQSQNQHQSQQQNVGNTTTNSHNNTNDNTANGGTGGTGGTATSNAVGGNVQGSQQVTEESYIPRQTASAFAPPPFHTSPCIKGWGGAAQTSVAGLSLGGGKVDKGCDIRETAAEFASQGSRLAYCKVMITEPSAKKAKVTLEDCMYTEKEPEPVTVPAPTSSPALPQIIVPAPQVTVNIPPQVTQAAPLPPVVAPLVKKSHAKTQNCPTLEK